MENVNPMPIKSNKMSATTYGKPDYMGYDEAGYQIRPMSVSYYPGMVGRPRVPYYYPPYYPDAMYGQNYGEEYDYQGQAMFYPVPPAVDAKTNYYINPSTQQPQ